MPDSREVGSPSLELRTGEKPNPYLLFSTTVKPLKAEKTPGLGFEVTLLFITDFEQFRLVAKYEESRAALKLPRPPLLIPFMLHSLFSGACI